MVSMAQQSADTTGQLDSIFVLAKAITPFGQTSDVQREEWQAGMLAAKTEETLLYLPGVHIRQKGAGQISTLQYRGLQGARIAQTWQGIPVSNPQIGTSDINELSLALVDKIALGTSTDVGNAAVVELSQSSARESSATVRYSQGKGYFLNGQWKGLRLLYQNDQHDFLHSFGNIKLETRETGIRTKSFGGSLTTAINKNWSSSTFLLHNDRIQNVQSFDSQIQQQNSRLRTTTGRQLFTNRIDHSTQIDFGILYDMQQYQPTTNVPSTLGSTIQSLFVFQKHINKRLRITTDNRGLFVKHDEYIDTKLLLETRTLLNYSTNFNGLNIEAVGGVNVRQQSGGVLFGSVSLSKKISESESVQFNLRRLGRIPSLDDLLWSQGGNVDLTTEKGWEISTFTSGKLGPIKITPLIFARRFSDYILWLPRGLFWSPNSIPNVNNFGAGLDLSYEWSRKIYHLKINGSFNYSELQLKNEYKLLNNVLLSPDSNLPFSPKFTSNLSINYGFSNWSWLLQARYTGEQESSYNGLSQYDDYAVFRSSISYRSNKFSFGVSCDNLTNTYIPTDYGLFSPLRRFELTLNFTLQPKK